MSRPIVTDETTLGELQTILTDLDVDQVGMNVTNGRWSVVLRREGVSRAIGQSMASLHNAVDDAIAMEVSTDTTVQ